MDIKICAWKTCKERFCFYVKVRLQNDINTYKLKNIDIQETSCMWNCKIWPNININDEKIHWATPIKASELLFKKLKNVTDKKYKN